MTPALIERAENIREKGTNRKRFFRGLVDKYTWVDQGSSFLPGELIASFLYGQLERLAKSTPTGWRLGRRMMPRCGLSTIAGSRTPFVPETCSHNAHLYYIVMPSLELRSELIARMKADGINSPFHYVPLHSSPAGQKFGKTSGDLPHTDDLSARLLRCRCFQRWVTIRTKS